jgi:O-antigen ligase
MAFFLFLIVNAALFIRPAEIVPALLGWEIYFYAIVACFIVAIPDVLRQVTGQSLESQPITICVFGLALIIPVPFLLAGDAAEAWRTWLVYVKIVIYYVLFVSLVTTPARLRTLLVCILSFAGLVTMLAVLRYHNLIELNTIEALKDSKAGQYGDTISFRRLQGTGIFQDPNELCVMLSSLLPACLYFLITDRNVFLRVLVVPLMPLFLYAVFLTQSRGGFIAFAGGMGTLVWMRFGWKRAAMIGAVGLPILLVLFAGRQTELSTTANTAQTRVELWRDWFMVFRENIVFGKGMSVPKEEEVKNRRSDEGKQHLAHNSFLQGFADMGVFGGCLMLGAFFTALWSLYRYNATSSVLLDRDLKAMQPFVLAIVAAYVLGMMTLTINYMVPTFMILALAVAYTQMARRSVLVGPPGLRMDVSLLTRFVALGFGFLVCVYLFIRVLA